MKRKEPEYVKAVLAPRQGATVHVNCEHETLVMLVAHLMALVMRRSHLPREDVLATLSKMADICFDGAQEREV